MSIFEYNGGAMVGMKGKNCVAIGCDRRLGVQLSTIATNFQKVFKMQDNILLGLTGLGTDIQTLYIFSLNSFTNLYSHALMEFKLNLYNLRENREMKPTTFMNLVSTSLYEKRYYYSNFFPSYSFKMEPLFRSTYRRWFGRWKANFGNL